MSDADKLKDEVIESLKDRYVIVPKYAIALISTCIVIAAAALGLSGWLSVRQAVFESVKTRATETATVEATETAKRVAATQAAEITRDVTVMAKEQAAATVAQVFSHAVEAAKAVATETVKEKVGTDARAAVSAAAETYLTEKGISKEVISKLIQADEEVTRRVNSIRKKDEELQTNEGILKRLDDSERNIKYLANDLYRVYWIPPFTTKRGEAVDPVTLKDLYKKLGGETDRYKTQYESRGLITKE